MTPVSKIDVTLPATTQSLRIVRQLFTGIRDELGSDQRLSDVRLAVTEACANAIVHAYRGDPGEIGLQSTIADGVLAVTIRDGGAGITPSIGTRHGTGIGLALMLSVADEVLFRSSSEFGTTVKLSFDLPMARQPTT